MTYKRRLTGIDWMPHQPTTPYVEESEPMTIYGGYDLCEHDEGSFWNSSNDDLFFETDADGHCLTCGCCYGGLAGPCGPAVRVLIFPPRPSVEEAQQIVLQIAERVEERERTVDYPRADPQDQRPIDKLITDTPGYGQIETWVTPGVSDELARVLLRKIAERMEEIPDPRWHRYGLQRPETVRGYTKEMWYSGGNLIEQEKILHK